MWNKEIWFALAWRIKDIQFRLKTWQQGREIARAYGESAPFHVRRVIRIALLGRQRGAKIDEGRAQRWSRVEAGQFLVAAPGVVVGAVGEALVAEDNLPPAGGHVVWCV